MLTSTGASGRVGDHMRTMIVFFIALLAIPIIQITIGPRFERPGAPVVIDRSSKIVTALGRHLRGRDFEFPMVPRSERRPKAG
jgi:hypothetical protein